MTLDAADGHVKSSFAKFMAPDVLQALLQAMDAKPGDALFFVADAPNTACTALGQLRLHLGRKFG